MTTSRPESAAANVMFDLSPSLRVNVWLTGDAEADAGALASTMAAIRGWLAHDEKTRLTLGVLTPEEQRVQERERAERQPAPREQPRSGSGQRGRGGRRPPPPDPNAPYCPVHRAPMRRNKRDDGWFCTKKDGDEYCQETEWDA